MGLTWRSCIKPSPSQLQFQLSLLDTLISSKTRLKLILKFFLNSNTKAYLRGLEEEFGESTNSIRLELNKFEEAGLLSSNSEGNKKVYRANISHPFYKELHNILMKFTGLDQVIDRVINRLGNLEEVYLVGKLSRGLESPIIDLVFVGDIDREYLLNLIEKTEELISKKIKFVVFKSDEFKQIKTEIIPKDHFLLWTIQ